MKKMYLISPQGEVISDFIEEGEQFIDIIRDNLNERGIPYDPEVLDDHKLCLDLSRDGFLIFNVNETATSMYVGKEVTSEQFSWFAYNAEDLVNLNITQVASWEDPEYEAGGYELLDTSSVTFNTPDKRRQKVASMIDQKNRAYERANGKLGLFGRAKR